MTVYVDDMRRPARVGRIADRWSHLFADSHHELETFARRLGLQPGWVQRPGTHREHFDLTDSKRALALRLGAQPISYTLDVPSLLAARRNGSSWTPTPTSPEIGEAVVEGETVTQLVNRRCPLESSPCPYGGGRHRADRCVFVGSGGVALCHGPAPEQEALF